ncbi:MAG: SWIM zinc finger family protein [Promethearchaeota archaeon]|nr:MAG: SWIM zinc finger family protein [Candidatus Lokiarchaeota archaeon]
MLKDLFLTVFQKAKEKKVIDDEFISFLETIFPDKSSNVLDVLKRGIIRYTYKPSNRIVWVAMGENQEHLIYPKLYCSCQDFYKSVVVKKKRKFCKHILAQIISDALNSYKEVVLEDKRFKELVADLKLKI